MEKYGSRLGSIPPMLNVVKNEAVPKEKMDGLGAFLSHMTNECGTAGAYGDMLPHMEHLTVHLADGSMQGQHIPKKKSGSARDARSPG